MDFTWNGVTASSKGIVVYNLPPIQTPQKRNEEHIIPYRNGVLHVQDGTYDELIKQVQIYLPYEQTNGVTPLNTIKAWLSGQGTVIFSDEPTRFYRAHIINEIDYQSWVDDFADRTATITFSCSPFAYHTGVEDIMVNTSGRVITNVGTFDALPKLAITGSGDVSIMIGQSIFELAGLAGTVTVDSEEQECYSVSGYVRTPRNSMMTGEFPTIAPGQTSVVWTGTVTSIVITPRWRDI